MYKYTLTPVFTQSIRIQSKTILFCNCNRAICCDYGCNHFTTPSIIQVGAQVRKRPKQLPKPDPPRAKKLTNYKYMILLLLAPPSLVPRICWHNPVLSPDYSQGETLRFYGGKRLLLFDGVQRERFPHCKPCLGVCVCPSSEEAQDGVGMICQDHIALCVCMCACVHACVCVCMCVEGGLCVCLLWECVCVCM